MVTAELLPRTHYDIGKGTARYTVRDNHEDNPSRSTARNLRAEVIARPGSR